MRGYYFAGAALFAAAMVVWGVGGEGRQPPAGEPAEVAEGGAFPPASPVAVVRGRLEAKERVVRALLAGEGTLLEAAARFREWDAVEPQLRPESHPRVYAGDTEAERYCRAVLFWANTPGGESAERSAAVRRLEDELEGHRLCRTLELPPPPRPAVYPETPADE
jgi:hypothetical protein